MRACAQRRLSFQPDLLSKWLQIIEQSTKHPKHIRKHPCHFVKNFPFLSDFPEKLPNKHDIKTEFIGKINDILYKMRYKFTKIKQDIVI